MEGIVGPKVRVKWVRGTFQFIRLLSFLIQCSSHLHNQLTTGLRRLLHLFIFKEARGKYILHTTQLLVLLQAFLHRFKQVVFFLELSWFLTLFVFVTLALDVIRLSHLRIPSFQLSLFILEFRFVREQFLFILTVFNYKMFLCCNLFKHPLNTLYILSAQFYGVGISSLAFQFIAFLTFKHLLALSNVFQAFICFRLLFMAKLIKVLLPSLGCTGIFAVSWAEVLFAFGLLLCSVFWFPFQV